MAQGTPSPFIPRDRRALVRKVVQHYQRGQGNKGASQFKADLNSVGNSYRAQRGGLPIGKAGNTPTPLGQGTPEQSGLGGGPVHIAQQGPRKGQSYRIIDEGGIRYHAYAKGQRIRIGPAPRLGASNPMASRGM